MCVIARKPEIEQYAGSENEKNTYEDVACQGRYYNLPEELKCKDVEDKYQNAERMAARYRHFCETHEFLGESFPNMSVDFGPGSVAGYLGSEIVFNEDTVWFEPCVEDWEEAPELKFDPENKWFKKHIELVRKCRELAGDDFFVDMPDLMENMDVLVSMRGGSGYDL